MPRGATCRVIENDFDCGKPAVNTVVLKDMAIGMSTDVPVCEGHNQQYRNKSAALRTKTTRKV